MLHILKFYLKKILLNSMAIKKKMNYLETSFLNIILRSKILFSVGFSKQGEEIIKDKDKMI